MLNKKLKLDRQICSYDDLLSDDAIFSSNDDEIRKIIQTEICQVEKLVREALAIKDRNIEEIKQAFSAIATDHAEVKAENKTMKGELEKCFLLIQEKNKEIEVILDENFKKENELMHCKTTIGKYFEVQQKGEVDLAHKTNELEECYKSINEKNEELKITLEDNINKQEELKIAFKENINKQNELVQCKNTLGRYVEKHIEVLLRTQIDKDEKKSDLKNCNLIIQDKNREIEILLADNINKENELVHCNKTIEQYFMKYNELLQTGESEMDSKKSELENVYQSLHEKNEELENIHDDMAKKGKELAHCETIIEEKDKKNKELLLKISGVISEYLDQNYL